jgi:hypothetical protein
MPRSPVILKIGDTSNEHWPFQIVYFSTDIGNTKMMDLWNSLASCYGVTKNSCAKI